MNLQVREYRDEDFDAVTILWRIARERSLPEFQRAKGYFFYQDQAFFCDHVLLDNRVYVAVMDGKLAGFVAIKGDFIDLLYIHPEYWRKGVGQALINFARMLSPEHLWLYTLQINANARAFYEKNGFVAEKFGISPAPELEPDVEYHWRAK